MSEHQYDIKITENYVDPNPLMVERQDPDNFICFQTRERCAMEIAAYVYKGVKEKVKVAHSLSSMPDQLHW